MEEHAGSKEGLQSMLTAQLEEASSLRVSWSSTHHVYDPTDILRTASSW